jgi:hypothetical protein
MPALARSFSSLPNEGQGRVSRQARAHLARAMREIGVAVGR